MRIADGATEGAGGVPLSSWFTAVVILCGASMLLQLDSRPRSPFVAVEAVLGCPAVHKYHNVTGGDHPAILIRLNHAHRGRKVEWFSERSFRCF